MHIPDGFLSFDVFSLMYVITLALMAYAVFKTNKNLGDKHVPLMGILASFVFAGQMLNVPVAAGTSGHMLGGVLTACFLGPLTASLVMAAVFIVQTLFFQDGGITALGANIFNMGLIGTIFGYYVYYGLRKAIKGDIGLYISLAIASWVSIMLAATATSLEISFSGLSPLEVILPAMLLVHAVIGLVEAGITVSVVAFVKKTRPDLLELKKV